MDLAARIQQLEALVNEAKSRPLSSSVVLNKMELLELVAQMREELPEEIKQARWVVKDREELLAKARRDAEAVVEKARAEQLRLASRQEVVAKAQEEAERILREAREQARQIRLDAEDYVEEKLARFEDALEKVRENLARVQDGLGKLVEQVERGREKLRGVGPEEQGPPGEEAG